MKQETLKPSDRELFRHPGVQNYVLAALVSLVIVFGTLYIRGSIVGGIVVVLFGTAGLFLRWTAAPVLMLLLTTYFELFPAGKPLLGSDDPWGPRRNSFRIEDMLLTMGLLVYVASQYRLFGILVQALPSENEGTTTGDANQPIRRPTTAISIVEFPKMIWLAAIAVFAAQITWGFLVFFQVETEGSFSVKYVRHFLPETAAQENALHSAASRFVLLSAIVLGISVIAHVVLWYHRMRVLTPDEAKMIVLDTAWNESRREYARVASWQAWANARTRRRTDTTEGEQR